MASGVKVIAEFLDHRIRLLGPEYALRDQSVGVKLARTRMLRNFLVHQRLRDKGLILLVMAELPEAHHVDDDVFFELRAVIERELCDKLHRLRIVAVDMKYRRLNHFGHIGAIRGRPRIARIRGGEPDLVVNDDVHGAAGSVAARIGKVQRFHDHALPRKSGIAMNQDGQNLVARDIAATALTGAHGTLDNRVDDFKMGRIERGADMHRAAGRGNIR